MGEVESGMDDCDKCNGTGRVFNGDHYELCQCKIRKRLQHYLQKIGHVESCNDSLQQAVSDTLDQPLNNYYIQTKGNIPPTQLNGLIAYLLRSVFPREYAIKNIYELHTELRDNDQYGDVLNYHDPLFILTAGLPEEFEGYTSDGDKWTTDAYFKTAQQVISNRQRFDLPTWVFERGNEYRQVRQYCKSNGFDYINCGVETGGTKSI
jgi:hypothetical protein